MRGRGLKQQGFGGGSLGVNTVAPHAGAWIETPCYWVRIEYSQSPPMRGRGLKHLGWNFLLCNSGRPPCGGVD